MKLMDGEWYVGGKGWSGERSKLRFLRLSFSSWAGR